MRMSGYTWCKKVDNSISYNLTALTDWNYSLAKINTCTLKVLNTQ